MDNPLVSVIIPVRNGEAYLAETLESVRDQTYPDYEILVVDGHSTDGTERIARSFPRVRFIRQEGEGIAAANNQGFEAARGGLISFLSHDDVWRADKLSRQVEYLAENLQIQCVITWFEFFLDPDCEFPPGLDPELFAGERPGPIPETLLARRSAFERVGGFNPAYSIAFDVDWFARALDRGITMGVIPEVMVRKRLRDGNASGNAGKAKRQLLRIMREKIHRRRVQTGGWGGAGESG